MNKSDYLKQLNETRSAVWKAVDSVPAEELSRPISEGKWSIKDTLGHLAAWEGEVIRAFEQKANGQRPTIGEIQDFDAWNNVESAKRKDQSVKEVLGELRQSRERLLGIINGLEDDGDMWSPERSTAKMLGMLIEHDQHHVAAIRSK